MLFDTPLNIYVLYCIRPMYVCLYQQLNVHAIHIYIALLFFSFMDTEEKKLKNAWKPAWLTVQLADGTIVSDVFKKSEKSGIVVCKLCQKDLNYATEGLKTIRKHSSTKIHEANLKTIKNNQLLPGEIYFLLK